MAIIVQKDFPRVGRGFSLSTQIIPPSGILAIIKEVGGDGMYRFSKDGGRTFTSWKTFDSKAISDIGSLSDSCDLIFDYAYKNFPEVNPVSTLSISKNSSFVFDKTIFKLFFENDDEKVLSWAVNVLEKLFSSGIVPLYIKRDNSEDYNAFFLTISQFFAYIVIYARKFREIESLDILMKEFIEGWGLVYENINSLDKRQYLFKNWKNEFYKRGTYRITNSEGVLESELKRLVGYEKPNEFIFAALSPQNIGWCLGWSSPTWYGTETVNAVSKGYDFGIDYVGENFGDFISFSKKEIVLDKEGTPVTNQMKTKHDWEIQISDGEVPYQYFEEKTVGVNSVNKYPIIGSVENEFFEGIYTLRPSGTGRSGISSEIDKNKLIEVYVGLDYEITVWVKAETADPQNIEFGVECYDYNLEEVRLVRVTDFKDTNSFFEGDTYQSPCKVPGIYYRLRGVIYNISTEKKPDCYLNFENGRPLRFMNNVKFINPRIVQNRDGSVSDIHIAGVCVKPLNLPFSQGYLGQKNVIAMYSTIRTSRTKRDIESFIKRYLVSYKNVVSYTWLDWVVRTSWFLTFYLRRSYDKKPISDGTIRLSNGMSSVTNEDGYCRLELPFDSNVDWVAESRGVSSSGSVFMDKDKTIEVELNIPLLVTINIIKPGWGTVNVEGDKYPYSDIILTATPLQDSEFINWVFEDGTEDKRNPTVYWLSDHDVTIQAVFRKKSIISFTPSEIIIDATDNTGVSEISSSKNWALDEITEDWLSASPYKGGEGETEVQINVSRD